MLKSERFFEPYLHDKPSDFVSSIDTESKLSFFEVLKSDLNTSAEVETINPRELAELRARIYSYLEIVFYVEEIMFLGCLFCLDYTLHILLILPLRVLSFFWLLIRALFTWKFTYPSFSKDMLRIFLLVTCTFLLIQFDLSWCYHYIRYF